MATKEQERKALQKIKDIVDSLGPDSYVAAAFDGCFNLAQENIDGDFMISFTQRLQKADDEIAYYKRAAESFSKDLGEHVEAMQKLKKTVVPEKELGEIYDALAQLAKRYETEEASAAEEIVEFADEPCSREFAQAVRCHREIREEIDRLNELRSEVAKRLKIMDEQSQNKEENC